MPVVEHLAPTPTPNPLVSVGILTQAHPPSAIHEAVSAFFTLPQFRLNQLPDLILSKGTQLDLYRILADPHADGHGLELVSTLPLHGVVTSLAVLKAPRPGARDALLVTFAPARAVLLIWDPEEGIPRPAGLFSAEAEPRAYSPFATPGGPRAVTDTLGRCAVLCLGMHRIALLPRQFDDDDKSGGGWDELVDIEEKKKGGSNQKGLDLTGDTVAAQFQQSARAPRLASLQVFDLARIVSGSGAGGDSAYSLAGAPPPPPPPPRASKPSPGPGAPQPPPLPPPTVRVSDAGRGHIRSAVFLSGMTDPTLLVLHEVIPTTAGLHHVAKDTCQVTAWRVDVGSTHQRTAGPITPPSPVWGLPALPADAWSLSACPRETGGALVLCRHLLLYVSQRQTEPMGLVVSSRAFADPRTEPGPAGAAEVRYLAAQVTAASTAILVDADSESRFATLCQRKPETVDLDADLMGCTVTWLSDHQCLLGLTDGRLLTVSLDFWSGKCSDMVLVNTGQTAPPSTALVAVRGVAGRKKGTKSTSGGAKKKKESGATQRKQNQEDKGREEEEVEEAGPSGLVFLGSALADSLLLRYYTRPPPPSDATKDDDPGARAAKKARVGPGTSGETPSPPPPDAPESAMPDAQVLTNNVDLEQMLYGDSSRADHDRAVASTSTRTRPFKFEVADSLVGLSPMRDVTIGALPDALARGGGGVMLKTQQLLCCVGDGKMGGALVILRQSLLLDEVTSIGVMGVTGIWSFPTCVDKLDRPPLVDPTSTSTEKASIGGGGPVGAMTLQRIETAAPVEQELDFGEGEDFDPDAVAEEYALADDPFERDEMANEKAVPVTAAGFREGCDDDHHGFVVLATPGGGRILQAGAGLREVTGQVGCDIPGDLVHVGPASGGDLVVAVHAGGVVLLEPCATGLQKVAELNLEDIAKQLGHVPLPEMIKTDGDDTMMKEEDDEELMEPEILSASMVREMISVVLSDGRVGLIWVENETDRLGGTLRLDVSPAVLELNDRTAPVLVTPTTTTSSVTTTMNTSLLGVTASALHEDRTGWLASLWYEPAPKLMVSADTEVLLDIYGKDAAEDDHSRPSKRDHHDSDDDPEGNEGVDDEVRPAGPVLVLTREGGVLEMYEISVPHRDSEGDQSVTYTSKKTTTKKSQKKAAATTTARTTPETVLIPRLRCLDSLAGEAVLEDEEASDELTTTSTSTSTSTSGVHWVQVSLESFGPSRSSDPSARRPGACVPRSAAPTLALVSSDGHVRLYRAFAALGSRRLCFRAHEVPDVPRQAPWQARRGEPAQLRRCLTRLDDVGETQSAAGWFLAGPFPCWLLTGRGRLVVHPHRGLGGRRGDVLCASPLHLPDCARGLVTGSATGISVGQISKDVRVDLPWVAKKVMLRSTPLRACYYPQAKLYAVAVREEVPFQAWKPLQREDNTDPAAAAAYAAAEARTRAAGKHDGVYVRLMDPRTWRPLRQQRMLDGEGVLALRPIVLRCAGLTTHGRASDPFIAVATAMDHGEDFAVYGRIVLLTVTKNARPTEAEVALGRVWDLQVAFSQQFRGAVTDIQETRGQLVAAVGSRIEVMAWSGKVLQRRLFLDRQDMIGVSLKTKDNLLLVADAVRGVRLIQYDEENDKLVQLGVSCGRMLPHAVELLDVETNRSLTTVAASDASGLLHVLTRHPALEWSGQQMREDGTIFVGTVLERLVPLTLASNADHILPQALLGAGLDGSLHVLGQITGDAAKKLRELGRKAANRLDQHAGLHPLGFRGTREYPGAPASRPGFHLAGNPGADSIVDGDLLRQLLRAPHDVQAEVFGRGEKGHGGGRGVLQGLVEDLVRAWVSVL